MEGTQTAPPADQAQTTEQKLFEGVLTSKDGVIQIDTNKMSADTRTTLEVGKIVGGQIVGEADRVVSGFLEKMGQHLDSALKQAREKERAAKTSDPDDDSRR